MAGLSVRTCGHPTGNGQLCGELSAISPTGNEARGSASVRRKKVKGNVRTILLAAALLFLAVPAVRTQASEPVVIVIDPGHGGENRGGEVPGQFLEKELTLQTAQAMKQTLEQFEGVEVYLTRTTDQELSLEERAQIAKA